MAKPKQFTRPPKKQKARTAEPQTAGDWQERADLEEEAGGKWRAGDPAKSGRAFVRALEIYDNALQKFPKNFDLAYNKARLELEITQQPALLAHIGLPLPAFLAQTLESHRYALRLNEENADILFNTSQVLISLAEQLSEADDSAQAIPLLHEALELLSACLSRQEMMLEQQQAGFEDLDEGGVELDVDERPALTSGSEPSEQTATIETPVTPGDLLDTVHASISALTTLMALVEPHQIETLGSMAQLLTEEKAPAYLKVVPEGDFESARFTNALDRANFLATFADAQFNAHLIEAETYAARLDEAFMISGKEMAVNALTSEGEARTELVLSVLSRFEESPGVPAEFCWQQLKAAQHLYTAATKLESSAQAYLARGDIDLLRHRLAAAPKSPLSEAMRKSAPTLAQNAQTYYRGAIKLATNDDYAAGEKASRRLVVASLLRQLLHGVEPTNSLAGSVHEALAECVEDGVLEGGAAEELAEAAVKIGN